METFQCLMSIKRCEICIFEFKVDSGLPLETLFLTFYDIYDNHIYCCEVFKVYPGNIGNCVIEGISYIN